MRRYAVAWFLLIWTPTTFAAGFEKLWTGIIMNWDQRSFINMEIAGDYAFLLSGYYYAHQFASGVRIERIHLTHIPHDTKEYYSPNQSFPICAYEGLFGLSYMNDTLFIEPDLMLQNILLNHHSVIHAPDQADYSHRFTPDGKYLGRFPGFSQILKQHRMEQGLPLLEWDGKPIPFPLNLNGVAYSSMIELEDVLLLLSAKSVAAVDIDEFLTRRDKAPIRVLPRQSVYQYVVALRDNYFMMNRKLYLADPGEIVKEIPVDQPPDEPASSWSHVQGNYFYQVETESNPFPLCRLAKYLMTGVEGLSGVESAGWKGYE